MQRLFYPTETVLSNKITRNRIRIKRQSQKTIKTATFPLWKMFLVLFLLLLQGCLVGRRRCCCSLNGRRAQIAVSMNNLDCLSGSVSFYELDVNKLSLHFTLEYSSRNSLSYEISRSLENKCLALFVASMQCMHISSRVL